MTHQKMDCTVPFGADFRVVLLTVHDVEDISASAIPNTIVDPIAARLAELPRLKVVRHIMHRGTDGITCLVGDMVQIIPQALIIIAMEDSIADARLIATQYNNVFHNSPSIVFSAQEGVSPIDLVGAQWTFDLGVMEGDIEALCALVKSISERENEDSPIALDGMMKVLWRSGDLVLLGSRVVSTL